MKLSCHIFYLIRKTPSHSRQKIELGGFIKLIAFFPQCLHQIRWENKIETIKIAHFKIRYAEIIRLENEKKFDLFLIYNEKSFVSFRFIFYSSYVRSCFTLIVHSLTSSNIADERTVCMVASCLQIPYQAFFVKMKIWKLFMKQPQISMYL